MTKPTAADIAAHFPECVGVARAFREVFGEQVKLVYAKERSPVDGEVREIGKKGGWEVRHKIYIASPYTAGDPAANVKRQMDCANELIEAGYAPFVPLLYHFQHITHPQDYTTWTEIDMSWVCACDAVLRLDGQSRGADAEVALAKRMGVPVYYNIQTLIRDLPCNP